MTSTPTARPPVARKDLLKAFTASLSGTTLEWYDFAIYSAAAAIVLPSLFFPSGDPMVGVLLAFSTYAVGYVSRPLGGVVFGRLGDKIGRKKVLVWTLFLIGVSTFLIGVLPTYQSISVAAPLILVLLRFAQGVGVGGEWGGAVLLSSEYGNPHYRGFWSSAAQIGPPAGNLLANGVFAGLSLALPEDSFFAWGWRVAFLLSAVLVLFGLWIRLKLEDTPVFKAVEKTGQRAEKPISELWTEERRPLISAVLSRIGPDVTYALFTVFTLTYGTMILGLDRATVLGAVMFGSAFQLVCIPLAGFVSDLINRRLLYGIATLGTVVWTFVFFANLDAGGAAWMYIGIPIGLFFHSLMYGPQAAFVVEQFSPRLRYTGASLAYTIAGVLGGALAPMMFTLLLDVSGSWVWVAAYLAGTCVLTLIGLAIGRDNDVQEDLDHLDTARPGAAV
ncbi:MFS transporter [Kocuria koreensis]|jgi:MFS family permease|uniref:Putative proline/betaine transporter n=1 Tax=Rothia koreensis TaxID=592378 RepID=A0A7M3SWB4_9MICC|nr:MFS transporter [Rothia koreensis]MUN56079.1 MFS transporter [Rothia koreensis]